MIQYDFQTQVPIPSSIPDACSKAPTLPCQCALERCATFYPCWFPETGWPRVLRPETKEWWPKFLRVSRYCALDCYHINSSASQENGGEVVTTGLFCSQYVVTFQTVLQLAQSVMRDLLQTESGSEMKLHLLELERHEKDSRQIQTRLPVGKPLCTCWIRWFWQSPKIKDAIFLTVCHRSWVAWSLTAILAVAFFWSSPSMFHESSLNVSGGCVVRAVGGREPAAFDAVSVSFFVAK